MWRVEVSKFTVKPYAFIMYNGTEEGALKSFSYWVEKAESEREMRSYNLYPIKLFKDDELLVEIDWINHDAFKPQRLTAWERRFHEQGWKFRRADRREG